MDVNQIVNEFKNNQLLMTVLGVSGAGMVSFWLRDFPRTIYRYIKRELSTELIITSQNMIFHDFLKWVGKNYGNKNFRKLKLTNGMWGHSSNVTTSIGYGVHFIRYRNRFFLLSLNKESANQTAQDKETITLTTMGRSRKIFERIVEDIQSMEKDTSKTDVYRFAENCWDHVKSQAKRALETVFIEKEKKDSLIDSLTKFIHSEQWYTYNGIPYQLGILLYGPPGTGKTSLIKAIASQLNYPIYYLPAQKISKIEEAVGMLPEKCLMVIEDIDSNFLTHSRAEKKKSDGIAELLDTVSLSEVLNSLDGMFSAHGRVLVATTNHIEDLDPALIRPGRIDLKIEIGFINHEIFEAFIKNFFPESTIDYTAVRNMNLRTDVTVAMIQNLVLEGKNEYEILEFVENK